ncbi:hypothetical protein CHARACLAT_013718 [Characodon lateralis]|uniref:Uncharacterized protein n=1 Tax=Characodon lateralis TaxID=208331 RepID=A0ABU7DK66_9TELE|nr:hypothetical protein [Characodon lateralis]
MQVRWGEMTKVTFRHKSHHAIGISCSCADLPPSTPAPASHQGFPADLRGFTRLIYLIALYIIRIQPKHTHTQSDRPLPLLAPMLQ